ncbi:hypothetical protein L226DRAFT_612418 [Lentinus tigrinus ALCF2SS1-7]|uniref:P-loop containing nucleoside triphosphate hydrolase protein n=1 Tax=Lentinus tigrinus ALCF2SS1-6 TaxID=1328759 RepID=A0A5C2SCN4_9APHY|nr:hypothetical protein L227DRAFT_652308 [Lentinus tigrinus ALCF2SS1-6]RPD76204.1 hypothetical protein L226DRAFT_612418 [Lentinus tigrinus ALCF2SS1-7]
MPIMAASEFHSPLESLGPELTSEIERVAALNADPDRWIWCDEEEFAAWKPAPTGWQLFANRWREATEQEIFDTYEEGARVLKITDDRCIMSRQHMEQIIVRDCYLEAYKVAWCYAVEHYKAGVVFTGQPGIGKTTFLWFLLVCLLQKKQMVLLKFDGVNQEPLLFHADGRVYVTLDASNHPVTSDPNMQRDMFIWSLFDVGEQEGPPEDMILPLLFPVQAPSPNLDRYDDWSVRHRALVTGLPLWTRDELRAGARLDREFRQFSRRLETVVRDWGNGADVAAFAPYPGVLDLLRFRYPNCPPASPDEAFDALLDVLIDHFGYVARDVYRGMYDFDEVWMDHEAALQTINSEKLEHVARTLVEETCFPQNTKGAHRLVCTTVQSIPLRMPPQWLLDFKSPVIAKKLVKHIRAEGYSCPDNMHAFLSSLYDGRGLQMARWFESTPSAAQ